METTKVFPCILPTYPQLGDKMELNSTQWNCSANKGLWAFEETGGGLPAALSELINRSVASFPTQRLLPLQNSWFKFP